MGTVPISNRSNRPKFNEVAKKVELRFCKGLLLNEKEYLAIDRESIVVTGLKIVATALVVVNQKMKKNFKGLWILIQKPPMHILHHLPHINLRRLLEHPMPQPTNPSI